MTMLRERDFQFSLSKVFNRDGNLAKVFGLARKCFCSAQPGINILQNLYYGFKNLLHLKIKFEKA